MNTKDIRLTVLRGLEKNPLFFSFLKAFSRGEREDFYYEIYEAGAESDFLQKLCRMILCDDNAFARTCAKGDTPSAYLSDAYADDLNRIFSAAMSFEGDEHFNVGNPVPPFDMQLDGAGSAANLVDFYAEHGYGEFIDYRAFVYDSGKLVPVDGTPPVKLEELKDYAEEKKLIEDNILNFLSDLPYADMLLYGDRGTGKSSTIHAMLNKYADDGLRIIELRKQFLNAIPEVRAAVRDIPLKFMIFIDDLSLDECDENLSTLKAGLEGSICGGSGNVMIAATSNRRHIVKESFTDRENSVHPADSMAEQLSLSDRFALTVMFSPTDRATYLSIIAQLADDSGISCERGRLEALAERWATVKGGRSPRRARQFIDLVFACEKRGTDISF